MSYLFTFFDGVLRSTEVFVVVSDEILLCVWAGLELSGSSDPLISTSRIAGTTDTISLCLTTGFKFWRCVVC